MHVQCRSCTMYFTGEYITVFTVVIKFPRSTQLHIFSCSCSQGNVADRIAGHNPPSDTYSVAPPTSLYSSTHSPLSMPPSVPMVPPTAPTSVPNVPMIPTSTPHAPTMFPPSSSVSKPPLFQPSSYTSQTSPMAPPPSSSTGCAWNDPPMLKKVTKVQTNTPSSNM